MAESDWGGNTVVTRTQFLRVRAALMGRGYAKWINEDAHNKGWTLTQKGRAVLAELAQLAPSPTEPTVRHAMHPQAAGVYACAQRGAYHVTDHSKRSY